MGHIYWSLGGNYTWFVFLNWLPYYFETQRHYTRDKLALIGSLPFWAIAVSSISFGLLADWLVRRGRHPGACVRVLLVSDYSAAARSCCPPSLSGMR